MDQQKITPKMLISPRSVARGGIKLFSLFDIDIYINYTWFIVVVLIAWSLAYGYYQQRIPGGSHLTYWGLGLLTSVIFFLCVLLHEISHSYVSKKSGIPVPRITLFIFGGVAQISREPPDPRTELKVAAAGPVMSGALFALFLGLYLLCIRVYNFPVLGAVFGILAVVNGAVVLFNLVPGFPLDGGRLLRAYLWKKKNDLQEATLITSRVGRAFALALIFLGFFQLLWGNIVGGIWLIFIGFFLEQAATSGYQQVLIREGLAGSRIREIMSHDIISTSESLSLSELVEDFFFKHRFNSYPVVKNGKFLGCVSLNQVKQFPKEKWDQVKVSQAMERLPSELLLHPGQEAVEAFSRMVRTGRGRLPVVDEGRLVGIVTRRDIMSFLKIRTDLGL
jgi:Zn-dependent protease/predicted transcriptional regulator